MATEFANFMPSMTILVEQARRAQVDGDKGICPDADKYAELEKRVGTLALPVAPVYPAASTRKTAKTQYLKNTASATETY